MSKEYVFVGRAQLKTRDYIYQIENENRELNQEIERLNNIINELEKILEKYPKCNYSNDYMIFRNEIKEILDKVDKEI